MTNVVLPGIKTSFNLRAHVQQQIGSTGKRGTSNSPKVEEFAIGGEEGMDLLPQAVKRKSLDKTEFGTGIPKKYPFRIKLNKSKR